MDRAGYFAGAACPPVFQPQFAMRHDIGEVLRHDQKRLPSSQSLFPKQIQINRVGHGTGAGIVRVNVISRTVVRAEPAGCSGPRNRSRSAFICGLGFSFRADSGSFASIRGYYRTTANDFSISLIRSTFGPERPA
jgi:hypothetical protein